MQLLCNQIKSNLTARIRLCPKPYKCPSCQQAFPSQLEFSLHHTCNIHLNNNNPNKQTAQVIESEDLEVMNAATVLTQFKNPTIIDESCNQLVIIY
jgi:hypothetical protein